MKRGIGYAGLAGSVWGFVILVPQLLPDFSPVLLSCGRFVLYGACSLLFGLPLWRQLRGKITSKHLRVLIKLCLIGNLLYFFLLATAIQRLGVAPASLILGVLPLTLTFMGRKESDAVSLTRLAWPLTLVAGGIACINFEAFSPAPADEAGSMLSKTIGLGCAIGALVCWTWFASRNARYLKANPCFDSHEWSVLGGIVTGLMGAVVWLVVTWLAPVVANTGITDQRWLIFWLLSLAAALLGSWFGSLMWNAASRRLPMTLAGQLFAFETVFALLYGFLYLQRWPTLLEGISIALLMGGVCWAIQLHAPRSRVLSVAG